jgi:hypothetical protein
MVDEYLTNFSGLMLPSLGQTTSRLRWFYQVKVVVLKLLPQGNGTQFPLADKIGSYQRWF